jgi:hypothetical protein
MLVKAVMALHSEGSVPVRLLTLIPLQIGQRIAGKGCSRLRMHVQPITCAQSVAELAVNRNLYDVTVIIMVVSAKHTNDNYQLNWRYLQGYAGCSEHPEGNLTCGSSGMVSAGTAGCACQGTKCVGASRCTCLNKMRTSKHKLLVAGEGGAQRHPNEPALCNAGVMVDVRIWIVHFSLLTGSASCSCNLYRKILNVRCMVKWHQDGQVCTWIHALLHQLGWRCAPMLRGC